MSRSNAQRSFNRFCYGYGYGLSKLSNQPPFLTGFCALPKTLTVGHRTSPLVEQLIPALDLGIKRIIKGFVAGQLPWSWYSSHSRPRTCSHQLNRSGPLHLPTGSQVRPDSVTVTTVRMFSSKVPCIVGDRVSDVETPALLVCLHRLEQNIETLAETMKHHPNVAFRPHVKTHKCPAIGKLQIKSGAVGLCCQTLTEAEAMVEGGIEDVLVSNQIIGRKKLLRLAGLARRASISVCVDNEGNIEEISNAASELGVTLDLVVEVNVGQDRCGVEPGEDVVRLTRKIQSLPCVNFKGIQCYNGWNQHIRKPDEMSEAVNLVAKKARIAVQALKDNNIDCKYITGGGTGTFEYEAGSGIFTEVQPGSYIMMDVDYGKNLDADMKPVSKFKQSLYVLSTVQSVSALDRAVLDAGLKAVSLDSGPPIVSRARDLVFHNGGDEHGILRPCGDFKVGDQVWLIPGHCDPTVNMHDWIIGLRDGRVESVWPISGRGPGI